MTNQTELRAQVERILKSGSVAHKDALRAVANTVLGESSRFKYEDSEPGLEQTYRLLEGMEFSGDGKTLLPADEIYALDDLLHKRWKDTFMSAVSNVALTMWATNPRTSGDGHWPRSHADCSQLLTQAFVWMCAQEGLKDILKDTTAVSHTRLAQFIIAFQVADADEAIARSWSLFLPMDNVGSVTCSNLLKPEYLEALRTKQEDDRPPEYYEVRSYKRDQLVELLTRLKLVGPHADAPVCTCGEDEEDCDCELDEVEDVSQLDSADLLEIFYQKYGDPDDNVSEDYDEDNWTVGQSLMEVAIDIPVVRLNPPVVPPHLKRKVKKTAMRSPSKVTLSDTQQIWHQVDSENEYGKRLFSITLVSRHTCGINRSIATADEALSIAYMLMDAQRNK